MDIAQVLPVCDHSRSPIQRHPVFTDGLPEGVHRFLVPAEMGERRSRFGPGFAQEAPGIEILGVVADQDLEQSAGLLLGRQALGVPVGAAVRQADPDPRPGDLAAVPGDRGLEPGELHQGVPRLLQPPHRLGRSTEIGGEQPQRLEALRQFRAGFGQVGMGVDEGLAEPARLLERAERLLLAAVLRVEHADAVMSPGQLAQRVGVGGVGGGELRRTARDCSNSGSASSARSSLEIDDGDVGQARGEVVLVLENIGVGGDEGLLDLRAR